MNYKKETSIFETIDGLKLFYQVNTPPSPVEGRNIVIHHGIGEHSDRYGNVLEAFEGTGVTFYSYDARGHGRSEGKKGHCPGVSQFSIDLETFLEMIESKYGVTKPVLLGHSMGGLVALDFALRHSNQFHISALAVSAPALRVKLNLGMKVKKAAGTILSKLAPELTMPSGLDANLISHDAGVVEAYKNDPLVHGMVSTSLGIDLLVRGGHLIENADRLKIPLYMAHGAQDGLTDPSGTPEFFHRAGSQDRELKMYPGLYHEIFNELPENKKEVLRDLRNWILKHMPESPGATPVATPPSQPTAGP